MRPLVIAIAILASVATLAASSACQTSPSYNSYGSGGCAAVSAGYSGAGYADGYSYNYVTPYSGYYIPRQGFNLGYNAFNTGYSNYGCSSYNSGYGAGGCNSYGPSGYSNLGYPANTVYMQDPSYMGAYDPYTGMYYDQATGYPMQQGRRYYGGNDPLFYPQLNIVHYA